MNKNIKYLIEDYIAFNPAVINDGRPKSKLPQDIVNSILEENHPKTKQDLIECIISLLDNGIKELNCIDVSDITDFSFIFSMTSMVTKKLNSLNYDINDIDISKWDVGSGENFSCMFADNTNFNCDISDWNVSSGINFNIMFKGCKQFNQDLSGWNVSNGQSMDYMFAGCTNLEYYDKIKNAWEANYDKEL